MRCDGRERIGPQPGPASDLSIRRSRVQGLSVGFRTLGGAFRCGWLQAGPLVEREVAVVCRCLEWPQAVSGSLTLAATFNPTVPDSGCFLRCSWSDSLEACSTGLKVRRGGWRLIATNDDLKLRKSD